MAAHHNLLLVDDDADDREIFQIALGKLGGNSITCATAADGPEALRKISSGEVQPSIIFLDLNMPMMNGQQVLQRLKAADGTRHIPVIILSTASDPYTIAQARQAGATNFYSKPALMAEWSTMLRSALASAGLAA